jgi:predicted ribosomally synthesized peptide with SipW-like signal peptide
MKKILLSLSMIALVAAVIAGATGAFFSDTETSTGNTFTAGAIDLGVDNHSYYNGVLNEGTTWRVDYDLSDEVPRQFFNFLDLKPGDWGEDTISLHVNNNDSYLCADVTLTSNNDNSSTEPELDESGEVLEDANNSWDGELANGIKWYWWADDGDNVFESDETLLSGSGQAMPNATDTFSSTVALADSQTNVWGTPGPLPGDSVRYVAKAWCFGEGDLGDYAQDGGNQQSGPDNRPVLCNGSQVNNITQTDGLTMDIAFRAVQSRNNTSFVCSTPTNLPLED